MSNKDLIEHLDCEVYLEVFDDGSICLICETCNKILATLQEPTIQKKI